MTRGIPGLCIEYVLEEGNGQASRRVSVGVQIQGTAYRHYVSASHPSKAKAEHSLQELANRLGRPSDNEGTWWSIASTAAPQFKKFDIDAFLYTGEDARTWAFEQLSLKVAQSLKVAAAYVKDAGFTEAARLLMDSRRR